MDKSLNFPRSDFVHLEEIFPPMYEVIGGKREQHVGGSEFGCFREWARNNCGESIDDDTLTNFNPAHAFYPNVNSPLDLPLTTNFTSEWAKHHYMQQSFDPYDAYHNTTFHNFDNSPLLPTQLPNLPPSGAGFDDSCQHHQPLGAYPLLPQLEDPFSYPPPEIHHHQPHIYHDIYIQQQHHHHHHQLNPLERLRMKKKQQRINATTRERNRMRQLDVAFQHLAKHVPTLPKNRKASKQEVLTGAINYIRELLTDIEAEQEQIKDIEEQEVEAADNCKAYKAKKQK